MVPLSWQVRAKPVFCVLRLGLGDPFKQPFAGTGDITACSVYKTVGLPVTNKGKKHLAQNQITLAQGERCASTCVENGTSLISV